MIYNPYLRSQIVCALVRTETRTGAMADSHARAWEQQLKDSGRSLPTLPTDPYLCTRLHSPWSIFHFQFKFQIANSGKPFKDTNHFSLPPKTFTAEPRWGWGWAGPGRRPRRRKHGAYFCLACDYQTYGRTTGSPMQNLCQSSGLRNVKAKLPALRQAAVESGQRWHPRSQ